MTQEETFDAPAHFEAEAPYRYPLIAMAHIRGYLCRSGSADGYNLPGKVVNTR